MKEIDELVEWVADKIESIDILSDQPVQECAREILSQPDLALIDRTKGLPNYITWDFDKGRLIAKVRQDYVKAGFTHSVIPLADALKEAKK